MPKTVVPPPVLEAGGVHANVLDDSPNPIVAVDEAARINYINPQTERTFGYTRDELIGQPIELLLPERVAAQHVTHRTEFLLHPVARPMGIGLDLSGRRKDGTEFPVEISLAPIERRRRAAGLRDRRRHHRAQGGREPAAPGPEARIDRAAGRRHRPRLQQHAVRDPRLRRAARRGPRRGRRATLRSGQPRCAASPAISRGSRAGRHADRPAARVQPPAGRHGHGPRRQRGGRRRSSRCCGQLIGENMRLVLKLDPTTGHIRADAGQLDQILVNLVVNARDAMPDGGTVTIETGNAAFDEPLRDRALRRDRRALRPAGGQRHRRSGWTARPASTSSSRSSRRRSVGKGTGLGLATTYGIVHQAGGHIWLYSEPGRGLGVQALLPARRRGDRPATGRRLGRPDDRRRARSWWSRTIRPSAT